MTPVLRKAAIASGLLLTLAPLAAAVHFYRGPGGSCSPADGALGDAPVDGGATVLMLHNTYHDLATGLPVTVIAAGESVTWLWASEHCHSATSGLNGTGGAFDSGFHYPALEPATPAVLPGLFHYPVPTLQPTLGYTQVFDAPGVYPYSCVHHAIIGMQGVVVVQ